MEAILSKELAFETVVQEKAFDLVKYRTEINQSKSSDDEDDIQEIGLSNLF